MNSIVSIMQQIAAREAERLYTTEIGEVTAVFPSDPDNYQCSVKLKNRKGADGADFELRKVPIATGHIGLANIPAVGDLVLVSFIGGDLNAPVVTGRLYNDADKPPVNDKGQVILEGVESLKITMKGGTVVEIDKDGNVKIADGHDNTITLDDKGINLKSGKDIILDASSGNVEIKGTKVDVK